MCNQRRSNAVLHGLIADVLEEYGVGREAVSLVESRSDVSELLKLDDCIDLVIPRGSNELVSYIQQNTKIPVLGHADGVCHIYVDEAKGADADFLDMVERIVIDAKCDYPAACNAVETLLLNRKFVEEGRASSLIDSLKSRGITLFAGDERSQAMLGIDEMAESLHFEYGDLRMAVCVVDSMRAAVDHIHTHGSGHSECIITPDKEVAEEFIRSVDAAAVLWNCSTRFVDGFRFGLGAEVGISTSRIHARGPVGVEGLLTSKWVVRGSGQIVDKDKSIVYVHKRTI